MGERETFIQKLFDGLDLLNLLLVEIPVSALPTDDAGCSRDVAASFPIAQLLLAYSRGPGSIADAERFGFNSFHFLTSKGLNFGEWKNITPLHK
jgi:hypothetical protein